MTHLEVDRRVARRLREWTYKQDKGRLWIEGPHHVTKPSQNTITAITLAAAAEDSGISVPEILL